MSENHQSKPAWYRDFKQSPFERNQWTVERSEQALKNLNRNNRNPIKSRRLVSQLASLILLTSLIIVAIAWIWPGMFDTDSSKTAHNSSPVDSTQLELFPGGDLVAGKPAGARWIINKSIAELEGRKVTITATQLPTGLVIEELPEITVGGSQFNPTRAYSIGDDISKTQIVTDMALPIGGKWRFQMLIDGSVNGEADLDVPEGDWDLSPTFKSGTFEMTGIKEKLGFIYPGFIEGKGNKYMWHFWGTDEELKGDFQVYGLKESSSELISVFSGTLRPSPHNGADASLPSSMTLPTAGKWKLIVTINGRWFENVTVQVENAS